MKSEDFFIYLGATIFGLVIFGLIIRWAVRADSIANNQSAIIELLIRLCRQHGVSEDELDGVKNMVRSK